MKITLTNFRCHESSIFEFPDTGLTLLAGDSGAGKSTVLTAICYALYGTILGKVRKTFTHGKVKGTKVEIDYQQIKIIRTSGPGSLTVYYQNKQYFDDQAQSIIDSYFGMSYNDFMASSYIVQNREVSVLTMTPAEQLSFIEKLAYNDNRHLEIKEAIKVKSKEYETITIQKQAQIDMLLADISSFPNIQDVEIPIEIQNGIIPDDIRKAQLSNNIKLNKLNNEISRLSKKTADIRESQKERDNALSNIERCNNNISILNDKIKSLNENIPVDLIEKLNAEKFSIRQSIKYYEVKEEYEKKKRLFEQLFADHSQEANQKIEELKTKVLSIEDCTLLEKRYNLIHSYLNILEKEKVENDERNKLKMELQNIASIICLENSNELDTIRLINIIRKQKMDLELQIKATVLPKKGKLYSCPCCDNQLTLLKDRLFLTYENVNDEEIIDDTIRLNLIDELENYINRIIQIDEKLSIQLPSQIPEEYKNITIENLRDIERKLSMNDANISAIHQLKIIPQSLLNMKASVESMKGQIDMIKSKNANIIDNTSVNELQERLSKISTEIELTNKIYIDISNTEKEIALERMKIMKSEAILEKSPVQNLKELEEKLKSYIQESIDVNNEIADNQKILDNVKEYEDYLKIQNELNLKIKKKDLLELSLIESKNRLEGYYGLERVCKDAEILAIDKTIVNINEHAKIYLEKMFEDPISVTLSSVKDLKKGTSKFQMNTIIEYKGTVYDSIDELSGGERQRCELAFLLAVTDMVDSPVLMLDECLNNLDANINTEVLTYLKELCINRMILVVSHEAVRGIFDAEIAISH